MIQPYAALIRAYQCTPQLADVIEALRRQTAPPQEVIIVDSSRDPETTQAFAALGATVVEYPRGEEFNFAKAINLGVAANDLPLTLIISSHVLARAPDVIERGWARAAQDGIEVVYWAAPPDQDAPFETTVTPISRRNFNGRNGLSNSMALIATRLLREAPFHEEVFSAEDQHWARLYFEKFDRAILRIETLDVRYDNPNHNETKLLNEELALGYFVDRRLLSPRRVAMRFLRGLIAAARLRPARAKLHFGFALALAKANLWQPKGASRYF